MGRTYEDKKVLVAEIKEQLSHTQMAIVIDYKGLTVAEITQLRNQLRPSGAKCKIAKNTLMKIAIDGDDSWQPMTELCKDSSAFLLLQDDIGGAIKAYQAFQKASKKTEIRGGVLEGRALSEADVRAIGDLPSKEELMGQIAGAINSVTTKLAVSIKEVPSSLARVLQAVADKENDAA